MHIAAVASRRVLVKINRCIGQIPNPITVPIALSCEIGILSHVLSAQVTVELCSCNTSTSVRNAMRLDFAIDQTVASCPAVPRVGTDKSVVQDRLLTCYHCSTP